MRSFPPEKKERLLELLGLELELFDRIRGLTAKQAGLLDAGDTGGFEKSLDDRQGIIDRIDGLHQESEVLMQSYISFSGSGGSDDAIEAAAGSLKTAITECVEMNDLNMAAAREKTEDYIRQIGELSLKRKSLGKYALDVPNNPTMFDKMT